MKNGYMVLRAYDETNRPTFIFVSDPSYTLTVEWKEYESRKKWFQSFATVVVTRCVKRVGGMDSEEKDMDLALCETRFFNVYKIIVNTLRKANVSLIFDRWTMDNATTASFVSNIGLPNLCSWYTIDLEKAYVDSPDPESLPEKLREKTTYTKRFIHIDKSAIINKPHGELHPLKIVFLTIQSCEQTRGRITV